MTEELVDAREAKREATGRSLLKAAATRSYDPIVDIDWGAPLESGRFFLPEHRLSLYRTPLWDTMTPAQRIDLSRHELASILSMGIWFETILMQMLIRQTYDMDPRSATAQFSLTEIGDETRHSVMFAKLIDTMDAPYYRPVRSLHRGGRVLKTMSNESMCFAGALFVEEFLDQLQREAIADDTLQPVARAVAHVHVVEEARHMRFAREEAARDFAGRGRVSREFSRVVIGATALLSTSQIIHPHVYTNIGLEWRSARRQAMANPHWRETRKWAARRVRADLEQLGMVSGLGGQLWKRAGLLGEPAAP